LFRYFAGGYYNEITKQLPAVIRKIPDTIHPFPKK